MRDKRRYVTLGVLLFSALSTAALIAVSVSFPTVPKDTTAKIAGQCMERGHQVHDLTENQVRCEIRLTYEQKGHILFTRFGQRRYTSQVRQFVGFTVVPTSTGSVVQPRQWIEAVIGGETRTYDMGDINQAPIVQGLVSLGGTAR